jgi:hypothetical protein
MLLENVIVAALVAAAVAFAMSGIQAALGSKAGSDHPAHMFIINAIRLNGHRLFNRIPGLLNTCYCGAIPLYTHWILSFFRKRAVFLAERFLNPVLNAAHVLVFFGIAGSVAASEGLPTSYIVLGTFAFALTPQFTHALSARNFGLSARGIGLVLLTLIFLVAYIAEGEPDQPGWWLLLGFLGWMVWAFSTFAQQALCLISIILFVSTGRYAPLVGIVVGLALFIIVHPAYSLSYLRYTYRFLCAYSTELAPIYVLAKRRSIWGDLVGGIWSRFSDGLQRGVLYAYENSLLIVVFLNPFAGLACWITLTKQPLTGLVSYAGSLALAGAIAALLTSFRPTRFLGEPERYVEAATPWAVLCGTHFVFLHWGSTALVTIVSIFAAMSLAQLLASYLLMRHVAVAGDELKCISTVVTRELGENVRFCSNNEQLTKLLLTNSWRFAFFWVVGQKYCGMTVTEAFSRFPSLKRDACERITETYRVNACLLDRKVFDTIFDDRPEALRGISIAYESPRFRLLILTWDAESPMLKPVE